MKTAVVMLLFTLFSTTAFAKVAPDKTIYLVSGFTKTIRCAGVMGQVVDSNGEALESQCFVLPYVDSNDDEGANRFTKALKDFNETVNTEFPWVYEIQVKVEGGKLNVITIKVVNPVVNS